MTTGGPTPLVLFTKVYLEDTDAQGVVYHANYLKYCERGRTESLATQGFTLGQMQEKGIRFVVYDMHLKFRRPAVLHDALVITTEPQRKSSHRLLFNHSVSFPKR